MKNKIKIIVLLFIFIFLINYSDASVRLIEKNIKDKFYLGEKLTGTINLEIVNESVISNVSINNNLINILSLLRQNYNQYNCIPYDCSPKYNAINPSIIKQEEITPNEKILGLKLTGNKVKITGLKLNISSDFKEEENIPLTLNFFRRINWVYNEPSTNYNNPIWGCYDTTIPSSGIGISPHEKFQISSSSRYCEKFYLPESGYIQTGALLESSASNELKISVYNADYPSIEISSCLFSPEIGHCNMGRETWSQSGEYYFCLGLKDPSSKLDGTINIFRESYGNKCGWYIPQGSNLEQSIQSPSGVDYSIFIKTGKYASAIPITIDNWELPELVDSANRYLNSTYKSLCSKGCVLPIFISGVNQKINISAILTYEIVSSSGGITSSNQIYNIEEIPAEINFYGTIDLSKTNTNLTTTGISNLKILFDNNELVNMPITIFGESSIDSISPQNPPAGLNTNFTLSFRSDSGISKIVWNFGDNTSLQTTTPNAEHTYSKTGTFILKVELTDKNGVTISKEFVISVTSPDMFIEEDLRKKTLRLENLTKSIAKLPVWYQSRIREKINVSYYESQLREINNLRINTPLEDKTVELFIRLQNLFIPSYVFISEESTSQNIANKKDINPEILADYIKEEVDLERIEDYKHSIIKWQESHIKITVNKTIISYFNGRDEIEPLIGIYSLDFLNNNTEDIYLIFNQKLDNLNFKTNEDPVKVDNSVIISFIGNKNIELFDLTGDNLTFFASPSFINLEIIKNIQKCNFNNICEKELGETISGCRSDCKPVKLATIYIIFLFILLFSMYSFLAWWYKYYYEKKLFRDRKQVYNIVMFILNSRTNGMSEWRINEMLKKQNWNSEQINYGFKRANGKRVGFPEIIPIEKIKLLIRKVNVKAKKAISPPQQAIVKW